MRRPRLGETLSAMLAAGIFTGAAISGNVGYESKPESPYSKIIFALAQKVLKLSAEHPFNFNGILDSNEGEYAVRYSTDNSGDNRYGIVLAVITENGKPDANSTMLLDIAQTLNGSQMQNGQSSFDVDLQLNAQDAQNGTWSVICTNTDRYGVQTGIVEWGQNRYQYTAPDLDFNPPKFIHSTAAANEILSSTIHYASVLIDKLTNDHDSNAPVKPSPNACSLDLNK